jgi:hypothetical protein
MLLVFMVISLFNVKLEKLDFHSYILGHMEYKSVVRVACVDIHFYNINLLSPNYYPQV